MESKVSSQLKISCRTLQRMEPAIVAFAFLLILMLSLAALPARASDFAMHCPPGWQVENGDQMLRRCISPSRDAFIEVYVYGGEAADLSAYLDRQVQALAQKGLPFHQFRKEAPGNVSGIPALTREYTGTANNALFHSYVVATSHGGKTYLLQALYLADRAQTLQPQIRDAMNSWTYPSVEQAKASPPSQTQPDKTPDAAVSGGRSYASRDQCVDYLCRPFSDSCNTYDRGADANHFRYLLCKSAWDKCYSYCTGYWSMALTCTKEAVTATQGYWISACGALAHDERAMQDCFRRGMIDGDNLLREMRGRPECKAGSN